MIFGHIGQSKEDWNIYPAVIQRALHFLAETTDLATRPAEEFYIDQGIKVMIQDITTLPREKKLAEVHKDYIDVQHLVCGEEHMVFFTDRGNNAIVLNKLEEADTLFYEANLAQENVIEVPERSYIILFPWDAHVPGVCSKDSMIIRKVVLKVPVAALHQ